MPRWGPSPLGGATYSNAVGPGLRPTHTRNPNYWAAFRGCNCSQRRRHGEKRAPPRPPHSGPWWEGIGALVACQEPFPTAKRQVLGGLYTKCSRSGSKELQLVRVEGEVVRLEGSVLLEG